jgi:hypothetical protein
MLHTPVCAYILEVCAYPRIYKPARATYRHSHKKAFELVLNTQTQTGAGHTVVVQLLLDAARGNLRAKSSAEAEESDGQKRISDGTAGERDAEDEDMLAVFLPDKRGQNALYRAAHRGHADVVRLLMREGGRCLEVASRGEDSAGATCSLFCPRLLPPLLWLFACACHVSAPCVWGGGEGWAAGLCESGLLCRAYLMSMHVVLYLRM